MESFFRKFKAVFTEPTIRNKVLFVVGALFVFRFLAVIPVPGIDTARLNEFLASSQFFGLFNLLSGGGLSAFSIVMLGVGPYITASIIMQLLSMMVPSLKEMMQENGEAGRTKFNQWVRLLSVPIATLQAFSFIHYLQSQGAIATLSTFSTISNIIIITGGSMLLLWIADLMTEFGVGNGTSMIIMAGILAVFPSKVSQFFFTFTIDQLPVILLYIAIALLVIAGVVYIYEAERPIKVTYAREVRGVRTIGGNESYIPLRLTQAGVMPIIFASSLLLFPQFAANVFMASSSARLHTIAAAFTNFLQSTWLYSSVYFLLVVFFTYLYTTITFDPQQIATNLQKNSAFIPGIRPGESTAGYLSIIVNRITLVGSVFLGIVAVLPLIIRTATGVTAFAVGGTSLLIIVSVVIDLVRRLDAQIAMREY